MIPTEIENQWPFVLQMLPSDLEESAAEKLALVRRREITSAQDLLRLCLAYSVCDMSLRQTAAWARATGLADLSNVAVMNRIEKSADWLGHLVMQQLQGRGLRPPNLDATVRIVDATVICEPGSKGTDWRLHLGLDLQQMRICSAEVTDASGGETFLRHEPNAGDIVVGDRGYAQRAGAASIIDKDAHALIRINWQNFPLLSAKGEDLDIVETLELLAPGEIGDWAVSFKYKQRTYPMRLIAIRKSDQAAENERKRIRYEAKRKKRKPNPKSLKAARFVYVLTDLSADVLPPGEALDLYRLRWQIEIFFKRLKGILNLGQLRAKNPKLVLACLYAKILAALIIDELRNEALTFFPWGYP